MAGRMDQSQGNVYLRSGFLSIPSRAAIADCGAAVDSAGKPGPRSCRPDYVLATLDASWAHALCPWFAWNLCWRSRANLQRLLWRHYAELVDHIFLYPIGP